MCVNISGNLILRIILVKKSCLLITHVS